MVWFLLCWVRLEREDLESCFVVVCCCWFFIEFVKEFVIVFFECVDVDVFDVDEYG